MVQYKSPRNKQQKRTMTYVPVQNNKQQQENVETDGESSALEFDVPSIQLAPLTMTELPMSDQESPNKHTDESEKNFKKTEFSKKKTTNNKIEENKESDTDDEKSFIDVFLPNLHLQPLTVTEVPVTDDEDAEKKHIEENQHGMHLVQDIDAFHDVNEKFKMAENVNNKEKSDKIVEKEKTLETKEKQSDEKKEPAKFYGKEYETDNKNTSMKLHEAAYSKNHWKNKKKSNFLCSLFPFSYCVDPEAIDNKFQNYLFKLGNHGVGAWRTGHVTSDVIVFNVTR